METTPLPATRSELFLPKSPLANCIFGAFARDTRGCNLPFEKRFNHFAASPLCGISWVFEGDTRLLKNQDQLDDPSIADVFPDFAFSGPYQQPQTSWNVGDVNMMVVGFYPDAMASLTGINISEFHNRSVAANEVLSGEFLDMMSAVSEAGNAEAGFRLIEEKLAPLWTASRPDAPLYGHHVKDWFRSLGVRAAMSGMGKSTRQLERRFRNWTGQSRRALRAYARSEQAFEYALNAKQKGRVQLADMSADLGYSDQSHMGRRIKEVTGFSPAEFLARYDDDSDEAFWCFRLMGQRF